jgi:hypothetical protein
MSQRETLTEMGQEATTFHAKMYRLLSNLEAATKKGIDLKTMADTAYYCREVDKLLQDLKVHANRVRKLAQDIGCLVWAQIGKEEPIRTEYCTASPKVKMMASLPHHKRQPEQYRELMAYMGLDPKLWDCEEPAVKLSFNGMIDVLTQAAEDGKPLPPGVEPDKTYPVYDFHMLSKKGIDEVPGSPPPF